MPWQYTMALFTLEDILIQPESLLPIILLDGTDQTGQRLEVASLATYGPLLPTMAIYMQVARFLLPAEYRYQLLRNGHCRYRFQILTRIKSISIPIPVCPN